MADEQPKPKAKPGPKKGAKKRICTVDECGRPHYAKGLCFTHWRASKGYGSGGDRATANAKYDGSERGKARANRSYVKRQLIKKLTGKTSVKAAFSDPEAVAKLRSSQAAIQAIWDVFTDEQKRVLRSEKT